MKYAISRSLAGLCAPWAALLALSAQAVSAQEEDEPFAESQMEQIAVIPAAAGIPGLVVKGFVDAGYIHITQSGGSDDPNGDLSWAYGNSQFNFSTEASTYTVNEVDLTLSAERDLNGTLVGALASIDYYPSRDDEIYQGGSSDRPFQVDQAFVYALISPAWGFRVRLGRAPGVVTLEQQQESEAPESRLIGHTYVYQAGGGYPYGVQAQLQPAAGLTLHVGHSNGGVGDYSFVPTDRTTTNRSVAPDKGDNPTSTNPDRLSDKTLYGAADYVAFDRPADIGRFQLGVAYANNPGLTYNATKDAAEPYAFTNFWAAYRVSDYEGRLEVATLEAFYQLPVGKFEAGMYSLLLSYELGAHQLFTLRYESISFVTDVVQDTGTATKYGLTYRLRIADPMALKLEYVTETQSPQFYTAADDLTTNLAALSWVYSF
jgi:hypothetical protein